MTDMRPLLAFSLVLLFGLPVYAADAPPSGGPAKDAKPAYQGKKDQCLTEKVSIEKGKLATENNGDSAAYKACVENNKKTGCTATPKTKAEAAKCTCGTVAYRALGDKVCGPISKCDPEYDKKVKACSEGAMGRALADAAIRDIASDAVKNIPRDAEGNLTDAGREQLSKTLQNLGVDEARAKEIVNSEKDSKSAYDMVQALAEGDTAKAQELATTLELNDEVKTNFARLEAKDLPDVLDGVMTKDQQDTARAFAQSTGFQAPADPDNVTAEPAALTRDIDKAAPRGGRYAEMFKEAEKKFGVPEGHLAGVAKIESNGNPNLCYKNDQSKACGLFQWIPSSWNTWSARWNAEVNGVNQPLSPNARFDPELATEVTAYYHGKNLERYGDLIANSGMDTSAALYAIHMFGDAGGPKFIRAYTDNPNTSAISVVGSAAVSANWPLLANRTSMGLQSVSLAEYEARVLGKMSGSTTFTASAGVIPGYSPFANLNPFSGPSNEARYPYKAAYTTPVNSASSAYGGSSGGVSSGGYAAPVQQPAQQPISQTILQQGNVQTDGGVTQTVQAVASIIAQPREVVRGNPIIVSWSSVGTSRSAPCEVFLRSGTGTSSIARGNEGSERVPTNSATAPIVWGFTLQCTALSGASLIQQATSVSIK